MSEIIKVQDLTKTYNEQVILNNISMDVKQGEIYGIIGLSGSGKSTLLRCINGIEKFDKGEIYIDSESVSCDDSIKSRKIKKKIGMIFQNFALLERKTVFENIALPMECWKEDKNKIKKRVEELMEFIQISHITGKKPAQISGGQKQRVAIARALSLSPKILLCDEATSALDPNTTKSILELLKEINKKLNITIIIVTHEMEVIKSVCDRMSILENGKIKVTGGTQEIFLKSSESLQNVTGNKILPFTKGTTILKLSFVSQKETTVLSHMSRDLNIDFSILSADIDNYNEKITGNIFISFKTENEVFIRNYLNDKRIIFSGLCKREGEK